MEEVGEVKERKGKENRFGRRYGFEIKLRCVKLYLEEGLPLSLLAKEVGASTDGVRRWVKAYQDLGEEGLRNPVRASRRRRKLPGPVRKKLRKPRIGASGKPGALSFDLSFLTYSSDPPNLLSVFPPGPFKNPFPALRKATHRPKFKKRLRR